ncbi:MAG: CotH kinase family protein, partial [Planctomycetota bacterium]
TLFDGYWDGTAKELSSSIWYSVKLPDATGNYVTTRVQLFLADGSEPPVWAEFQHQAYLSDGVDDGNCAGSNETHGEPEIVIVDGVAIFQRTVPRYDFMECGEIVATGGFIQGGTFDASGDRRYTGMIVDVIVHDTVDPPSGGSRTSTCFTPDEDPPTPDPATWDSGPAAEGPWSITMTATPGDDQTRIEYYFEETSGNEGGASSGWQRSNTYTDQFLTPETEYTYRVRMKDTSGNMTNWSESRSTTTDEIPSRDCPEGDLDDDCDCDFEDMLIFVGQWLDPPGCLDHIGDCADIVDPEGVPDGVNVADFSVLAADWMDAGEPIILVINELMASNSAVIADEHGEYDDWIEIYNAGALPVLLSGMYLEDDGGNRWQIPPNVGINPGEFLLFWADDGWPGEGLFHTNFKLSKGGDGVTLYDTDGTTILDTISYSSMESNRSYGRYPDATDNWYDMADTTPAATNARGLSGEVNFSHSAGIITSHFSLSLTTATPGAVIRYTTDGSEPTETTGQIYSGPISITNTAIIRAVAIDPGHAPGPVKTKTYLSLADIYSQPALPAGFPDVWHEGHPVNYQMYPPVITEYASELNDAFTSIPSLSIVMDMDDLFSQETGIYPNSEERGVDWERPASAELLFGDGSEGFGINCGIRVYGAGSAMPWVNLKHSFRLLFKGDYGPTKLDFPFFDDSPVDQFDTIILRGGSNHCWASREEEYQRDDAEYIRDIFARDTQRAMGELSSHGNFVHLFLNGVYWGLYNPSERPDAAFLSEHYGGEKEDWDAMNSGEIVDGNREAWNTMMSIAEAGLETQEAYEDIQEYLDVENLVTYMIFNHYIGNLDWAEKNWYAGRLREPGAGFRVFSWDAELSMFDPDPHEPGDALSINNLDHNVDDTPQRLFHQLRGNEEFRMLYADHLHRHLFNGGALTPNACIDRYSQRVDQLSTAIIGESARWGDQQMDTHEGLEGLPYTRDDDWIPQINWLLNDYMPSRPDVLLDLYRDSEYGLYPE